MTAQRFSRVCELLSVVFSQRYTKSVVLGTIFSVKKNIEGDGFHVDETKLIGKISKNIHHFYKDNTSGSKKLLFNPKYVVSYPITSYQNSKLSIRRKSRFKNMQDRIAKKLGRYS